MYCNTIIQLGRGLKGLLGEFSMAAYSLQPMHAPCTVAVHLHYIPYFIFNNLQKHPTVESSVPQNKMKKEFWSTLL